MNKPRKEDNLPSLARDGRGTADVFLVLRCWSVLQRQQAESTSPSVDDVFNPVRPPSHHPPKSRGVSSAAEGGTHEPHQLEMVAGADWRKPGGEEMDPAKWPQTKPAELPCWWGRLALRWALTPVPSRRDHRGLAARRDLARLTA